MGDLDDFRFPGEEDGDGSLLVVEDRSGEHQGTPKIVLVQQLDDGLSDVVAESVVRLGIPDGASLIKPTSGLLLRNKRGEFERVPGDRQIGEEEAKLERESAGRLDLLQNLLLAVPKDRHLERLTRALCLGDRAVFLAGAGTVGCDYANGVAHYGYTAALQVAETVSDTKLGRVTVETVPILRARFRDAAKIVADLMGKRNVLN